MPAMTDAHADRTLARCLAARPNLTARSIEGDMIRILTTGSDDPDYFLSLLGAARRALAAEEAAAAARERTANAAFFAANLASFCSHG